MDIAASPPPLSRIPVGLRPGPHPQHLKGISGPQPQNKET